MPSHGAVGAVAADCPPATAADVDTGVLGGALPAEDRVLDGGAEVLEPGVGLGVRVWVTVAVGVLAPEPDADGVSVTVVASVVVLVSGEVFPPRIVNPEFPPDSGPPLTLSTSVTAAMLPAKITPAAATPASTTVDGRRDRRGANAAGWPALGMTTVGSSSGPGTLRWDGRRSATAGVAGAAVAAPAGADGVVPGRTSRSAVAILRRVTSRE